MLDVIEHKDVLEYINAPNSTKNIEQIQAIERFKRDLLNKKYDFRINLVRFVIEIIEKNFVHVEGEDQNGVPFNGKPLLLSPFQKFIIYNLVGFYHKGTNKRRFKEAFIFIPRKNGKTTFVASLAWALGVLDSASNSKVIIIGSVLEQAKLTFNYLMKNVERFGGKKKFRIKNNSHGYEIEGNIGMGSIRVKALAGNHEKQDGYNSNIQICDELHTYKTSAVYEVIKESGKAYENKMCIGISTAGTNANGFCSERLKFCQKILNQSITAEQYFIFIAKVDDPDKFDDETELIKANPNVGYSVKLYDLMNDAFIARNDPQTRNNFLNKSCNIFTNSLSAYFDLSEFERSDNEYNYTLEELAKLPIKWYGGADLSKMHDLTASALYGHYEGVDIVITHAFFPRARAEAMANDYGIPLFEWEDNGNLTFSNTEIVYYDDVVKWFDTMRANGFKIVKVGYDRRFANEFVYKMRKKKFKMEEQSQLYIERTIGFRHVERQVKIKKFYYLHSRAFEYCVSNVEAVETYDDVVKYRKTGENDKIDIFDACIFACLQYIKTINKNTVGGLYVKKNKETD